VLRDLARGFDRRDGPRSQGRSEDAANRDQRRIHDGAVLSPGVCFGATTRRG
jgi:hypothetical protein